MLEDQQFYNIIKIFTSYIMNIEMKVIINNFYLRFTSNNINFMTLNKFTFDIIDKLQ